MLGSRSRALAAVLGLASIATLGLLGFARVSQVPSATAAPVVTAAPPQQPEPAAKPPEPEGPPRFEETLDVSSFLRGNIHTHSSWSDGDKHPKHVYAWYRNHGYAFVALTDHENRASPETFKALERKNFTIIAGEEITMTVDGHPVHVNGLCTRKTIAAGGRYPTKKEALAHAVESVRAQGGVALVNHPNFDWALTIDDVREARGAQLLEIWSGHPYVNTEGDAERPSHEAIWDTLLASGERFAGVAVDDTHHIGLPKKAGTGARPGKGWIEVFGDKTEKASICGALAKGQLYSSSGVTLKRIRVEETALSVWPKEKGAIVEFIGAGGTVLEKIERVADGQATYRLRGDERYVRARITTPDGKKAWTQAYFVTRK
ncbi:PHP domain-containing protein [Polyangium aurulentum]|uniref:PHP domain-containing protein n=1 Tax=Polyangium aurulentum TaxID=2567896 RepID=UPI00146C4E5A|nr:CehA/McbA family metallohydrolase [Polyangium aurulentum]UQA60115.1 CehA/McbA family metallohydrolase [Polyangium aurulentum]